MSLHPCLGFNEDNLGNLFGSFLVDYWYAIVFWLLLMVVMVVLYNRVEIAGPQLRSRVAYYATGVMVVN